MLEVVERYWAGRGFDLVADVYDHGHQFGLLVKKSGLSDDELVTRENCIAVRCKMKTQNVYTSDEVLECHHKLLGYFPQEAANG